MTKIKIIPCSENWDTFTPTQRGAFCAACKTEVVDFRAMSGEEIKAYFKKRAGQSVCGHYNRDQLDTYLIDYPEWENQKHNVFQSKFMLALIIGFGVTLFSCENRPGLSEIQQLGQAFTQIDHSVVSHLSNHSINSDSLKESYEVKAPVEVRETIYETFGDAHVIVEQEKILNDIVVASQAYKGQRYSGIPVAHHQRKELTRVRRTVYKWRQKLARPIFTVRNRLKSKGNLLHVSIKVKEPSHFHVQLSRDHDKVVKVLESRFVEEKRLVLNEDISDLEPGKYRVQISAGHQYKNIKFRKR